VANTDQASLETLKEKLHPANLWQSIVASKDKLMAIAICFGLGFVSGYLFKKHVQLIVTLVMFILGLVLLQYLDLIAITINTPKVCALFGLAPTIRFDNGLVVSCFAWSQDHLHIVLSFAIGFLFGVRSA